ncbi:MAG: MOSC domain-containing protein [Acidimicrobiales bacterium]
MAHLSTDELLAGLDHVRRSPVDGGALELIVARPTPGAREVLDRGELSCREGLVGDGWRVRGSKRTADGSAHPDMQLNIINARFSALVSRGDPRQRAVAGDQLHVDLDLSAANLPPGTRLAIGSAVIEVTDQPHTGCVKFSARFGVDALRFVNSAVGKELHLRGINARVVQPGTIGRCDTITKLVVVSPATSL